MNVKEKMFQKFNEIDDLQLLSDVLEFLISHEMAYDKFYQEASNCKRSL